MGKITNSLKQAAVNGKIPEDRAIRIAKHADALLERTVELLTNIRGHFGMFIQEEIDTLKADITNVKSRDQVYFFDKEPDGQ